MFTKGILFGNSNNYGDGPRDDQPIYGIYNEIQKVKANLSNNIFTTKPLIGILIAVIAIMLLIGIVVSVLYRIPGAFGFFSLFSAFSIALMVMILTGFVITLPIFIGLLIGLIAGTFAIFAVCERIKKQARTGVAFDVAVKKGLKRSILPIIDIHIILIVIGMCLSFIGFTELTAVGNAMLILGLISAVFMGPVFFGVTILFFLNGFNRLKTNLMLSKKFKMINSNNVINGKQYETTLNGGFEIRRFHIFGWKQIVALSVVLAIIIAGIILLFTVGVHSSYMFYGGTRIVVTGTTTKPT
jgi:SecD/SecF fusion protein